MTQVTPPGWYPDPGQTYDGPATERWWDGTAWTQQVRPAGTPTVWGPPAPGIAAGPAYPAHPAFPAPPPSRRGHRVRNGIALAVGAAVLASIGVGVYALADGSGGSDPRASQGQGGQEDGSGGSDGSGGEEPGPDGSEAPWVESGSVTDATNGISLPVPEGWHGRKLPVGAAVTSEDEYDCPGDPSKTCVKGGVYSAPAPALGTRGSTAEQVAKADISANAEESYGGDAYGEITSHDVLASKPVTVAGQKGYLVRWRAVTSKGSDGFVQSLAFPSPERPQQMVVIRAGIDTDQSQSVLDEITEGIEAVAGAGGDQDV